LSEVFLSKVVSDIFSPFIVLSVGFFIGTYHLIIREDPIGYVCFMILATTLPAYFYIMGIFNKLNDKGSGDMTLLREDRHNVYLAGVFSSIFAVVILTTFNMNTFWIYNAMLGTVFFGVIFFINRFIDKISLHTAAFGFMVVYIANSSSLYWLLALAFMPFIAMSRLTLKKHTKLQLGLGIAVGMFIGLLSWTFI
jgi:hypothetical protein